MAAPKLLPKDGLSTVMSTKANPVMSRTPPSDLFQQLGVGEKVQEFDIKLMPDAPAWQEVEVWEIGSKIVDGGIVYARFTVPEDYVALQGSETIDQFMICWVDAEIALWVPVTQIPGLEGMTFSEARKMWIEQRNQRLFVAKPVKGKEHVAMEVPPRHRQLYPGERLRRGDKMIHAGLREWVPVLPPQVNGFQVEPPELGNGFVLFCRPVPVGFQNWYVDPEKGKPGFLGGPADPFISMEVAQQAIENAAKVAKVAPFGIIWQGGVPRTIYDAKEPPERVQTSVEASGGGSVEPEGSQTAQGQAEVSLQPQEAVLDTAARLDDEWTDLVVDTLNLDTQAAIERAAVKAVEPPPNSVVPAKSKNSATEPQKVAGAGFGQFWTRFQVPYIADQSGYTHDEIRQDATRQLPRGYRLMSFPEEVGRDDLVFGFTEDGFSPFWQPIPESLYGAVVEESLLCARRKAPEHNLRFLLLKARQQYRSLGETLTEIEHWAQQRQADGNRSSSEERAVQSAVDLEQKASTPPG